MLFPRRRCTSRKWWYSMQTIRKCSVFHIDVVIVIFYKHNAFLTVALQFGCKKKKKKLALTNSIAPVVPRWFILPNCNKHYTYTRFAYTHVFVSTKQIWWRVDTAPKKKLLSERTSGQCPSSTLRVPPIKRNSFLFIETFLKNQLTLHFTTDFLTLYDQEKNTPVLPTNKLPIYKIAL
jgi:hypothetical protein